MSESCAFTYQLYGYTRVSAHTQNEFTKYSHHSGWPLDEFHLLFTCHIDKLTILQPNHKGQEAKLQPKG